MGFMGKMAQSGAVSENGWTREEIESQLRVLRSEVSQLDARAASKEEQIKALVRELATLRNGQ